MKRIIQNLKERVGVKGALIMTGDGVVAASDLGGSLDADSVAALASASVLRAMKSAAELGLGSIQRLTLTAAFDHGPDQLRPQRDQLQARLLRTGSVGQDDQPRDGPRRRPPDANKGELTSISTDGDRTLFFDFMPLDLGKIAGMRPSSSSTRCRGRSTTTRRASSCCRAWTA
jgi:hypothetical protein